MDNIVPTRKYCSFGVSWSRPLLIAATMSAFALGAEIPATATGSSSSENINLDSECAVPIVANNGQLMAADDSMALDPT